jgi:CXXC-20-CXXC protein
MKPCPHCGKEVRVWRLWSAASWTPYRCPHCGEYSEVTLASRAFFGIIVPLPVMAFGVFLLVYFHIHSWIAGVCVIAPVAFAGSYLMGFMLACFGRFRAIGKQPDSHDHAA